MSDGICPVGGSVAVGGKGLSESWKGHSIEEDPVWCLVSSCFLFLLWSEGTTVHLNVPKLKNLTMLFQRTKFFLSLSKIQMLDKVSVSTFLMCYQSLVRLFA